MSILGVGLDLCDIRRIRRAMENPRFAQRAFTQGERERIAQRGEQTAAGLFAAKASIITCQVASLTAGAVSAARASPTSAPVSSSCKAVVLNVLVSIVPRLWL